MEQPFSPYHLSDITEFGFSDPVLSSEEGSSLVCAVLPLFSPLVSGLLFTAVKECIGFALTYCCGCCHLGLWCVRAASNPSLCVLLKVITRL